MAHPRDSDFDERSDYSLETSSPEELRPILAVLVDEFRDELGAASVDGYPEPSWSRFRRLPDEVKAAHHRLAEIARGTGSRKRRNDLTRINLDLTKPDHLSIFTTYAPYSIYAYAMRKGEPLNDMAALIDLDDEGWGSIQVTIVSWNE